MILTFKADDNFTFPPGTNMPLPVDPRDECDAKDEPMDDDDDALLCMTGIGISLLISSSSIAKSLCSFSSC